MNAEKLEPQDQEAAIPYDPALNKQAINEAVDEYEKSANSEEPIRLVPSTQKELSEVERTLEDSLLGIDDAL